MIDHDAAANSGTATSAATATRSRVASSTPPRARRRSTRSAKSTAPTVTSCARSTATSASSSACSTRSRATIAVKGWRALISPRRPARSAPSGTRGRAIRLSPATAEKDAAGARARAHCFFRGYPLTYFKNSSFQSFSHFAALRRSIGPDRPSRACAGRAASSACGSPVRGPCRPAASDLRATARNR